MNLVLELYTENASKSLSWPTHANEEHIKNTLPKLTLLVCHLFCLSQDVNLVSCSPINDDPFTETKVFMFPISGERITLVEIVRANHIFYLVYLTKQT